MPSTTANLRSKWNRSNGHEEKYAQLGRRKSQSREL